MSAVAEVHYLSTSNLAQVETKFDQDIGVYWGYMNPRPRPCFNPQLLAELKYFVDGISRSGGSFSFGGKTSPIGYAVIASKTPGVFNLGGDLALFKDCIARGDRERLLQYGTQCVDNLFPWHQNCDLPLTTISLVQGEALGGGFECALSSSVLIAEESSRMGFPEILFNLFPGMGAYSYLSRKVGRRTTEELLTSGSIYTARQLYDMGVVDVITPDGTGEAAVHSYVRKHSRSANGRRAIERVRNEIQPITRDELMRVVGIWVDAAMKLDDRDLRMMDRLVRAQQRTAQAESEADTNVVSLMSRGGD